jgi:hypothetical protein
MKDTDSRPGREIAELARLLPVPAERGLPADREQTLKEHLLTEFRTQEDRVPEGAARAPEDSTWASGGTGRLPGGARRASARGRHPKRTILVAAAGAGVLVVATAVAAVSLSPSGHTTPPGVGGHAQPTAAQLLAKIADAAARQPTPVVRDSQYEYIKSVSVSEEIVGILKSPGGKRVMGKPTVSQSWGSVSDVCRPGLARSNPPTGPGSSPDQWSTGKGPGVKCPSIGGLNDPTYRLLQTLPTNPRTLLNLIYTTEKGHGPSPDQEAYTTIGDLLRDQIAPPRVSAALYRAAALIPGVTVVPDAVNAAGKHGVAVVFMDLGAHNVRDLGEEWIFDRTTSQMIGESTVYKGKVTSASAILQSGFVDRLGEVPAANS